MSHETKSKIIFLSAIFLAFFGIAGNCRAANWYVDNAAAGANNGTSWSNAWQSFSSIQWTSVNPGDTVFISGGADEKTYAETLTVSDNGSDGLPVTLRPGQDEGHNGVVTITGVDYGLAISGRSFVTVDGDYNGSKRIRITGCLESGAILDCNGQQVILRNLRIDNNGDATGSAWQQNGILINGYTGTSTARRCEIAQNLLDNNYYDQIHMLGGSGVDGWDATLIHDNELVNLHDDGIETGSVGGLSIYNNSVHGKTSDGAAGHPDGIATNGADYLKVYNNHCYDVVNSGKCFSSCFLIAGQTTTSTIPVDNVRIYNNVASDSNTDVMLCEGLTHTARGFEITKGPNSQTTSMQNWYVANNTAIGFPYYGMSILPGGPAPVISGWRVENNISSNCGRNSNTSFNLGTTGDSYAMGNHGDSVEMIFDYNLVHAGETGSSQIVYRGTPYSYADFKSASGANSHDAGSPTDPLISAVDGQPQAASPAVNVGATQTFFDSDKLNVSRPQGSAWDIGAYEYAGSVGDTYYADNSLGASCVSGNYSIANRTCGGTDGNAYQTVQAAVNAALPGDTVYVREGSYAEEVNTARDGEDEAGRITIRNYGSEQVIITQADINHNYNTVQGFTILGHPAWWTVGGVRIGMNADHCEVKNNTVRKQVASAFGIHFSYSGAPPYPDAATDCAISGNVIEGITDGTVMEIWGANHQIINNTVTGTVDSDFLRIWGHNHLISQNTFDGITDGPSGNHIDAWQTFGDNGYESYGVVIERNFFRNVEGQICQITPDGVWTTENWIVRNNVFINFQNGASVSIPIKWHNNTFYNVNQVSGHVMAMVRSEVGVANITRENPGVVTTSGNHSLISGTQVEFTGVGGMTELNGNRYTVTKINNTSFSIGVDTNGYGAYASGGYAVRGGAYGSEIKNNIFLKCGTNPGNAGFGWYSWEDGLSGYSADYNYAAGTSYATKDSSFSEPHGVNGGNPFLADEGGPEAEDYFLTSSSAVLLDKAVSISGFSNDYGGGTRSGTWDIGAYEYAGSGGDTTPPGAPSGLNVQ